MSWNRKATVSLGWLFRLICDNHERGKGLNEENEKKKKNDVKRNTHRPWGWASGKPGRKEERENRTMMMAALGWWSGHFARESCSGKSKYSSIMCPAFKNDERMESHAPFVEQRGQRAWWWPALGQSSNKSGWNENGYDDLHFQTRLASSRQSSRIRSRPRVRKGERKREKCQLDNVRVLLHHLDFGFLESPSKANRAIESNRATRQVTSIDRNTNAWTDQNDRGREKVNEKTRE